MQVGMSLPIARHNGYEQSSTGFGLSPGHVLSVVVRPLQRPWWPASRPQHPLLDLGLDKLWGAVMLLASGIANDLFNISNANSVCGRRSASWLNQQGVANVERKLRPMGVSRVALAVSICCSFVTAARRRETGLVTRREGFRQVLRVSSQNACMASNRHAHRRYLEHVSVRRSDDRALRNQYRSRLAS